MNSMRKILTLILILFSAIIITGCNKNKVINIEVEDIITCIDSFDISEYSCKVTYQNESVEIVNLSLEMLSQEDQNKLFNIGDHQVTLNYQGFVVEFNIILEERKASSITAIPSTLCCYLQEFSYDMISLEITFNDKSIENISLSRDILDKEDIIALGKAGTYDIEVEYEEVVTIIHIELLPNEVKIEDLDKKVVVYCITKKVNDKYQTVFYALGNDEFASIQFKLKKSTQVEQYTVINCHENIYINEETLTVSFVSSDNLEGIVELFTIEFASSQQYRNFSLDSSMKTKIIYIENDKLLEVDDYIFTFTR